MVIDLFLISFSLKLEIQQQPRPQYYAKSRHLSEIGLDNIWPKVPEFLADNYHSFLSGNFTGMEFIHPHLCIPIA